MRYLKPVLSVALAVAISGAARPATATTVMYADEVIETQPGGDQTASDDPTSALGAPDMMTATPIRDSYYDLGSQGTLTVGFPGSFCDMPGVDVLVWEVGGKPIEHIDIQLKINGTATIDPTGSPLLVGSREAEGGTFYLYAYQFDLADLGAAPGTCWDQLTVVDDNVAGPGGADIDAVAIVPEPLTVLGVFLGVSGLGAYIRKRRTA